MTETENTEATEPQEEAAAKKGGGLLKYVLFGGVALIVVIGIVFGTMFLLKDSPAETIDATDEAENHEVATSESHNERQEHQTQQAVDPEPELHEDDMFAEPEDPTVIENIMDNLAFLDYQPEEEDEVGEETEGMSVEDSLEELNWLEKEKAALAQKEKALAAREKELAKLDREVSKSLLILEQAETVRVGKLAKLYDGMDPRSVAQLMANLDDATVVSLLPRMKTKNASSVMALMPAKRAARLSKQMITIAEK